MPNAGVLQRLKNRVRIIIGTVKRRTDGWCVARILVECNDADPSSIKDRVTPGIDMTSQSGL